MVGVLFGGAADDRNAYYPLAVGRMIAVDLATGAMRWSVPLADAHEQPDAPRSASGAPMPSFSAAPTVIPGVVFVGGYDGKLIALSTQDGRKLWEFDTARSYRTVNGVSGQGGSMGSAGPTVAGGMLFVGSGYAVTRGMPGNVLLAFSVETHGGEGVVIGEGLRYAHAVEYLHNRIAASGLKLPHLERASPRAEANEPVRGLVAVVGKT